MNTLPKDASHWQQQLFTLDEPVTLPKDLFDQVWPPVSSVYTFRNKKLQQKGTIEVEHGECRLKKAGHRTVLWQSQAVTTARLNGGAALYAKKINAWLP